MKDKILKISAVVLLAVFTALIALQDIFLLLLADGIISIQKRNDGTGYSSQYSFVTPEKLLPPVEPVTEPKEKLIFSVYPDGNIETEGNSELSVSCEAEKGIIVWAMLNGTKIELSEQQGDGEHSLYFGTYTSPAASSIIKKLGNITFYADKSGEVYSVKGGSISVKPYNLAEIIIKDGQGIVEPPRITGDNRVEVLTPYSDNVLGGAYMCEVTYDSAETVPAETNDAKSDPRYTPYPQGSVDYITGEFQYEDKDYFVLLSGVKVRKEHVSAFDGYIMPSNTVSAYNSFTRDGYTSAILTMNWKAPFVSDFKEQNYYRGYAGRLFNVNEFKSSYIDFRFNYTNACEGEFDFPESGVVKNAKWVDIGNKGTSTLRVYLRNSNVFYGYKAYYSDDNRLVIQFKERPDTSSPHIVIDPGHGGKDCGAIAANGTFESVINLRIASMLKKDLESVGCRVTILRTDNSFYSLDERQLMARKAGGDIFVSLHNNSNTSPVLSGTEVYYYRAVSKKLAQSIHTELASTWKTVYGEMPEMMSRVVADDGGVRFYPFQVTRIEECPAVLIECGYLSHPTECEMLCRDDVQQYMAQAVANGIINYFNNL